MCGITGVLNINKEKVELKTLKKMADAISHRGPDDEGFFIEKNVGLAHRRLSIIDLTKQGHQPMSYNDNLVIVYNGEVYNYLEIKDELLKKGYKFASRTDTEVVLAAYKEWGVDCLKKFNGMWSFVIYDKKKNILFAARDRLGVKPFYYCLNKDFFTFGSEIKALLKHPKIQSSPNDKIVWDYLICGLVDHSEQTFFQGIKELRPGHFLELGIGNGKMTVKKYWDLKHDTQPILKENEKFAQKFRELFIDSVQLRLRSDVTLGTCLSGGLDSSAIVCVVNDYLKKEGKVKQIGKWQQTFSSVFNPKKYRGFDEREFIREVILKTKAKPHYTFPDDTNIVKDIKKVIYHQDYPFCSTSIYAQWNVFKLAQQNKIKVMLDGQGSDESLAGYHPFFGIYFAELLRKFKIGRLLWEMAAYSFYHDKSVLSVCVDLFVDILRKGFLGGLVGRFVKRAWPEYEVFNPDWKNKFTSPAPLLPTNDILKNGLYSGMKIGLVSLLRYEDRDSMAFSIESRVPFLDYRLVEFIYSLPNNQKIRNGQTKWVMRQALKRILPEKIRRRQDKIGFATPEEIWMKGELGNEMKKVFCSKLFNSRPYFRKGEVFKQFMNYLSGKNSNYQLFWRIYNFEIWMRVFIDR